MLLAKHLTHLDLCTGIGGFTIAAGWAGFDTVGFAEIEPYCSRLLLQHWPGIPNYGDLRSADFSGLMGQITVLTAGVPCQPASLAGKRKGARDDRWLWPAVLDVVGSVKPAWCIFENPTGILTLDEFNGVLLRLEEIGYDIRCFSVPANSVGAKHLRYRVFIVANSQRYSFQGRKNEGKEGFIKSPDEQLAGFLQLGSRPSISSARTYGKRYGVYGRPYTVKRNLAIGNSVVPQQAYPFLQAISQTINHA